ncbi:hypothetical protein CERSUDRAFT_112131 [Gelatoporia subvermispora B]|uniref:Phosphoglycerate mutase-like protein n=1 Tax=Ceriporiopsis subvermispora (strain B) TaxID=914234 RepID=M2RN30_CERS8|nr:hypothetical protein CERSUDRAFT_112131 [Gelatoporia subvermispora B]
MSPTAAVTFTFIRHGESTDNLRDVWAGWKDAPLSIHGMNQAKALGESLSSIRFTAINASPLKRALWTAQAVHNAQQEPKPPLTTSPLLREQHWGVAEGQPWTMQPLAGVSIEEHFARGIYPVLHERSQKFPEAESLDDLARRADQAVEEILMPYILQAARSGERGIHVAIVSHGLCISELIPALMKRDASGIHPSCGYRGLFNTAWSRVTVNVKGAKEGEPVEFPDNDPPHFEIRATDLNCHEHLNKVARQKGGIGRAAYDPKQQEIRAFFGGGATAQPQTEEGRSESNARDESEVDIQ